MMRPIPKELFTDCADILAENNSDRDPHSVPQRFLDDIGYSESLNSSEDDSQRRQRLNFLKIASKMDLFILDVPDAPQLNFVGGKIQPQRFEGYGNYPLSSASGVSTSLTGAFESCVAEGIEYLSQHPSTDDILNLSDGLDESIVTSCWDHYLSVGSNTEPQRFLIAKDLTSQARVEIPESLCLRNPTGTQYRGMSTGCAAGNSLDDATVSALLELIERDAAALWWEGGSPPRPISAEALSEAGIESLYSLTQRQVGKKATIILDITTDVGIPSVVALSTDLDNGTRFACGLASRLNLKDAIYKAVLEMLQMEVSHHVLAMKQQIHGAKALNDQDIEQLQRSHALTDIWSRPCLQTVGAPQITTNGIEGIDQSLNFLLERFRRLNLTAHIVDLTRRSLNVSVVKAIIPALQTYPIISNTTRLSVKNTAESNPTGVSLL